MVMWLWWCGCGGVVVGEGVFGGTLVLVIVVFM